MKLYPRMRTQRRLWVDAPPDVVAARLSDAIWAGEFKGEVRDKTFSIQQQKRTRNSWRPMLSGTLSPANGGTLIAVDMAVHRFVLLFTIAHGLFFLGITWLVGMAAFSSELSDALKKLQECLGVNASAPLSDPAAEGAEAEAPWSFSPQATLNTTRFTLYGTRSWRDAQAQTVLQLESAKIVLNPGDDEEHIPWHAAAGAQVQDSTLLLGAHALDVGDHPPAHRAWLASHLQAQAARFSASEQEREEFTENAAQLAAIAQATTAAQKP